MQKDIGGLTPRAKDFPFIKNTCFCECKLTKLKFRDFSKGKLGNQLEYAVPKMSMYCWIKTSNLDEQISQTRFREYLIKAQLLGASHGKQRRNIKTQQLKGKSTKQSA